MNRIGVAAYAGEGFLRANIKHLAISLHFDRDALFDSYLKAEPALPKCGIAELQFARWSMTHRWASGIPTPEVDGSASKPETRHRAYSLSNRRHL